MPRVYIPTPLRSYTANTSWVNATGDNVGAILDSLNDSFPGIRFRVVDEQNRVRKHMKIFVNDEAVRDLDALVGQADEVTLLQALSGG